MITPKAQFYKADKGEETNVNEWTIVGVIIVMLGFAGTILALSGKITKPIEKLNCSIVELTAKFNGLTDRIDRDGCNNEKEHVALWDECEKNSSKISEHDTDIAVLKEKIG